jgi:CBS domain-containing protein
MRVAEVLSRKGSDVSTIRTADRVNDAVSKLSEARIGALVVTDRWGKLAGIFSERDLVHGLARHGAEALEAEVHELMTPDVTTCALNDRIDDVMATMTAHRIRHMPVLKENRLVGIVSIGDLVKLRLDEKEEEAKILLDITRAHV